MKTITTTLRTLFPDMDRDDLCYAWVTKYGDICASKAGAESSEWTHEYRERIKADDARMAIVLDGIREEGRLSILRTQDAIDMAKDTIAKLRAMKVESEELLASLRS